MPLELFQTPQQIIAPMAGIALYILCLKNDYVLSNDPCNRRFDPHKFSEISGCKYNKRNASSLKLKSPENSEDSLVAGTAPNKSCSNFTKTTIKYAFSLYEQAHNF